MRFATLARSVGSIVSLIALLHGAPVKATHLMGAELTYTWLGGNDYIVRLAVWRDCYGVAVNASEVVQYASSCGSGTADMVLTDTVEISTGCSGQLSTCQGGTYPGAELYYYRDTVSLSACADWVLSWTTCCRNDAITSIMNPGTYNLWVSASLDNLNQPGNSSPVFQELTGPFVCVNTPICIANYGYDPDGDSLVYQMTEPLDQFGTALPYLPGFSVSDPYPSSTGHALDPTTGNHCATPNTLGAYVMAYAVEEWRNGVVVGRSRRDLQIWVVNCPAGNVESPVSSMTPLVRR
ncbi:MAG: hypothetical protein IPK99_00085 [Flavobacteriales bacterium]|nr:hypothetical protein [Flavobacteriales bacterium]